MPKAEISWKRTTPEGETVQCYARHVGKQWIFYRREKRFDPWAEIEQPPLEDWLALLDSVQRRINRRLLRPESEVLLRKIILERFPGTEKGRLEQVKHFGRQAVTQS
jgi:hypothetical protein